MNWLRKKENWVFLAFLVTVFLIFFYIDHCTPPAGDDWGYAVNGRLGNPFGAAWDSYMTWSGRYFSELWGVLVAPHKRLWELLNPLLFTTIMGCGYVFIRPKKNHGVLLVTMLGLLLSVDWQLRKETYTWIMGSTYVVPLALFMIYLLGLEKTLSQRHPFSWKKVVGYSILTFIGCMFMENMTAIWVLANLLIILYCMYNHRELMKKMMVLTAVSLVGLLAMRLSPGATARLLRDSAEWAQLSLFEQIGLNWNAFLTFTFINNKYILRALALVGLLATWTLVRRHQKWSAQTIVMLVMNLVVMVFAFAEVLHTKTGIEFFGYLYQIDTSLIAQCLCTVVYLGYVAVVFLEIFTLIPEEDERFRATFVLLLAGTGNLVMLISPIFGPRSSFYTVMFLILLTVMLLENCALNLTLKTGVLVIFAALSLMYTRQYIRQYRSIAQAQNERMEIIRYYQEHEEAEEYWIPRFPEGIVHSADVEDNDPFHQQAFKEYYGLDVKKPLIFYHK